MIDRNVECGEMVELLEEPTVGFRAAVVEGDPGIGKTTLIEAARQRAQERGWRVLAARPAQSEARLRYVALADLLAEMPEDALDELPLPQRRALDVALLRAEARGAALTQRAVAAGTLAAIQALTRSASVLIVIDDAQWLDPQSAAVLEYVARRLRAEPVRLLLTRRPETAEPFPLDAAIRALRRIKLGPLSLAALHDLIRTHTGEPLARRRLIELERLSGGNPLFALELVRAGFGDGTPRRLPAALGDAALMRVASLPRRTQEELLIAVIADRPTTDLLDRGAFSEAVASGIAEMTSDAGVSFTHPLLRWAVLARSTESDVQSAHRLLADRTADEEQRVRHLALAATGPDSPLAAELESAAERADARDAPVTAAELMAHARSLTPPDAPDDWARRAAREILLLRAAGDWERAWEVGQEALERLPAGPGRAAVLLEAAEQHPDSVELCRQALQEAGGDPALSTRAHLSLAQQRTYQLDVQAGADHAKKAVALAARVADPALLATALVQRASVWIAGGLGDPTRDLDEAAAVGRDVALRARSAGASTAYYRATWLTFTDHLDLARNLLDRLLRSAIESGDERTEARARTMLGVLEGRAGRWPRAVDELGQAIQLSDLTGFDAGSGRSRAWLAGLQARRGDFASAGALLGDAQAIAAPRGDRITQVICLSELAFLDLAGEDPEAALAHVDELRRHLGGSVPVWLEFEYDAVRAIATLGRVAEAEERLAALRLEVRPSARRRLLLAQAEGIVRAASGDLVGAAATLCRASDPKDVACAPFVGACGWLLQGQLERRIKQKAAARVSLAQAESLFHELGAEPWADRARTEAARLGLRRAKQELTETEQRVAELAAAGKSNREIAAALFISRRTVETNVARIYRKLGVNTRAALANRVADGSGRDAGAA